MSWLLGICIAIALGAFVGVCFAVHRWLNVYDSERRQVEYKKEVAAFMRGYSDNFDFKRCIRTSMSDIAEDGSFRIALIDKIKYDENFKSAVRRVAKNASKDIIIEEKDRLINFVEGGLEKLKQREDEFLHEMGHYRNVLRYIEQLYVIDDHDGIYINRDLRIPYEVKTEDEDGIEISIMNEITLNEILRGFEFLQDYLEENNLGFAKEEAC